MNGFRLRDGHNAGRGAARDVALMRPFRRMDKKRRFQKAEINRHGGKKVKT
jgi:hypothetical protein